MQSRRYLLVSVLATGMVLCACGRETTESLVLPAEFLQKVCHVTAEEWIEPIGHEYYNSYSVLEDGSLSVNMTEEQKEAFRQFVKEDLKQAEEKFCSQWEGYSITCDEKYKSADFFYNLYVDRAAEILTIAQTEMDCIYLQLLDGCPQDSWDFDIHIYNCDTGNPVASGNVRDGLTYDFSDWEKSRE